jgi:hypothetical protein
VVERRLLQSWRVCQRLRPFAVSVTAAGATVAFFHGLKESR